MMAFADLTSKNFAYNCHKVYKNQKSSLRSLQSQPIGGPPTISWGHRGAMIQGQR